MKTAGGFPETLGDPHQKSTQRSLSVSNDVSPCKNKPPSLLDVK